MAAPSEQRKLRPVPDAGTPRDVRASRPYLLTSRLIASGLRRALSASALVLIDVSGLAMAIYGALVAKELYLGHDPILWGILWDAEVAWLPFVVLVTFLVFWRAGLYARREIRPGFSRVLSSLAVVAIVSLAFGIATNQPITTGSTFVVAFVLGSVAVGLMRWSYDSVTREVLRSVGARRRAIVVGSGGRMEALRRSLGGEESDPRYEFVATLANPAQARAALDEHEVDEILVEGSQLEEAELIELLDVARGHGVKVHIAPTTAELLTHGAAYVPGQAVPIFELKPPILSGADWAIKRAFDLAVSTLVVLAGLPLWLVIAAAVKLTSPGPVFYRDPRVGVGEERFSMLKFRTMVADAGVRQDELEAMNEADGALFKLRRDPRVTRVGRLLRRLSLDEVPQVLNVLRGEMSLVGPRPLPLRDYGQLESWHRKRYNVLPGITGLWQISGRSNLSFDDLVRLDFYYLENWSIWLDVSILLKTVPAVLGRRGAY